MCYVLWKLNWENEIYFAGSGMEGSFVDVNLLCKWTWKEDPAVFIADEFDNWIETF